MYLHEYQSKQYFARFDIPTLQGRTATTQQMAYSIAAEFGVPVVVNAQVLTAQRVFRLARTPQEAEHIARDILAMTIDGVRVRTLLIEPSADVLAELTLGIYADRGSDLFMLASNAGSDIIQMEHSPPETLIREAINPFLGVLEYQGRNLANGINLPREHWNAFIRIAQNLYRCFVACDAVRAEINPLGLTRDGELIVLGGKLVIDDNALFRQPELTALHDVKAEHESAVQAREAGITFVRLSGTIACIVSGAGLGMATMDLLADYGAAASCFVDLGSNIQRDKLAAALRLINPQAQAIIFNIFADKTSCADIAHELLVALAEAPPAVPLVIRLAGQNAEEGQAELSAAGIAQLSISASMVEAVQLAVAAAKGITDVRSGR